MNNDGTLFITSKKANKYYCSKLDGLTDREYKCADYFEVMHNISNAKMRIKDYNETLDNFHKDINLALEEAENTFQSLRKSIK